LTCKNRLPYNLYCVGGDVKHCSTNQALFGAKMWGLMIQLMANLMLKFPSCCYHSNRGSTDTNFNYAVKLRPHKRVRNCLL